MSSIEAPARVEPRRAPSLRITLAGTTALVALIALLSAGALLVVTTVLHRTTQGAGASVESVHLAEEAEVDLLLHERADDPLVRRGIEEDLRGRLADVQRFVTTAEEARILSDAVAQVDAYVASSTDPGLSPAELAVRQEAVFGALEALVAINLAQAREAQDSAAWWNQLAKSVGIGAGALLLLVAGAIMAWLRRRAFAPIFALAAAMERFGRGERGARAPEDGPAELREMSRRFNEMATAIAAQRQAQLAFIGGIAHDLKNPLSVLKLSVTMVRPGEPLPPDEGVRQILQRIDRQIIRLERMLGDFLDMAKIEAGELELKLEADEARALVRDAVDLFEGAASSEHRLEVSLPEQPVPVHCDHFRIEQVVTNLISNAIKYSPPGSPIEVAVEPGGDEVVLRVTDQGVGISEADRERLFEPFQRVGLARHAIPGAGLGLFVVRRIVEAHGGRIDVESAPGVGSTFRVHLPARRDAGQRLASPVASAPS